MNILHINEQMGWRGGEQQASYLIAGLGARGHDCYVAARPGSAFMENGHGGKVQGRIALPLRGDYDVLSARKIAAFASDKGIQILHAHTGHAHMIACLARMFGRGLKVVVSRRVEFAPARNPCSRFKYSLPDRYVAISSRIGRVLEESGISPARISVVHSGVSPARLDVKPVSRAELGLQGMGPLIGNVAALEANKDQKTLIAAMAQVLETFPEAGLVIAGEGGMRTAIEAQISELGIGRHVHLLGHRKDVPAILKALNLFVLSSREEGLGTSVLDAMACCVPVVATAAGGIPEMVRHEETGLLVPAGDDRALAEAIARLLNDAKLANRLAERAARMVTEEFSAEAMIEGNIAVYEELLKET